MDEVYPHADVHAIIEAKRLDSKTIYDAAREAARAHPRAGSFETKIPGVRICIERKELGLLKIVRLEMTES